MIIRHHSKDVEQEVYYETEVKCLTISPGDIIPGSQYSNVTGPERA